MWRFTGLRQRALARALPQAPSAQEHAAELLDAGWRRTDVRDLRNILAAWPDPHVDLFLDLALRDAFGTLRPTTIIAWATVLSGDADGFVEATLTDGSHDDQEWLADRFHRWTVFGVDLAVDAYGSGLPFEQALIADDAGLLTPEWLADDPVIAVHALAAQEDQTGPDATGEAARTGTFEAPTNLATAPASLLDSTHEESALVA